MIALLAMVAFATDDYRSYVDQGKFFVRKKWFADAEVELEKAVATEDGRIDPEAWYLLATVRYELGDVPGAVDAAGRAHSYARNDEQLTQAAGFSDYLLQQFGVIELAALQPGYSALTIELTTTLFDPALKEYLSALQARIAKSRDVLLPYPVGLPSGTYLINGKEVVVKAGDQRTERIPVVQKGPVAVQVTQLEVALGVGTWMGGQTENLLPAPTMQLAVSQPVGRLILGVMTDWTPQPYNTLTTGLTVSTAAWSVGARAGIELPGTEPLVLRGSVGYRFATLPGVEMPCARDASGEFVCAPGKPTELMVYPVATAHVPLLEIAAVYQNRTRETNLGIGVKGVAETAFASMPKQAEARRLDDDTDVAYRVADRSFTATGLRIAFELTYAF